MQWVLRSMGEMGSDDITDLVFINLKSTDYCGHYLGSESLECGQTLQMVDAQIKQLYDLLSTNSKGDLTLIVTADHGVAPLTEISGGKTISRKELAKHINEQFSKKKPGEKPVVNAVFRSYFNINLQQIRANGYQIEDVKKYLENYKVDGKPFFEVIYTYKDIDPRAP